MAGFNSKQSSMVIRHGGKILSTHDIIECKNVLPYTKRLFDLTYEWELKHGEDAWYRNYYNVKSDMPIECNLFRSCLIAKDIIVYESIDKTYWYSATYPGLKLSIE